MLRLLRSCSLGAASASAAILSLSSGCTTGAPTTVTDVWRDPSYAAGPMHNVVVFAGRLNETNRRTLEDNLVSGLSAHGVHAVPSYMLFPGTLPSKDEARSAIQQAGADGVLVSSMHGVSERTTYVPGAYDGGFWSGYYGPGWGGVYDPGYVVTDQYVKFETSLWDPKGDGRMVWSAVTQTANPSSGTAFATSLSKTVMSALTKAGFLPATQQNEGKPAVSYRR